MKTPRLTPEQFLRQNNREYRADGNELYFDCFGCDEGHKDGSCSMNTETGIWNCLRATCRGVGEGFIKSGTLYALRVAIGEVQPKSRSDWKVEAASKKSYKQPELPAKDRADLDEIKAMVIARGINPSILNEFGIFPIRRNGVPALAFPYYRNNKLVNIKYRLRDGDGKKEPWKYFQQEKDARPSLYAADRVQPGNELIIVEGEWDCIASWQLGVPAVSVPGGISNLDWIETEWEYLSRFNRIVLAVDMDAEGDIMKLANRLGMERCFRASLPEKDLNDCLKVGWGPSDWIAAIEQAEPIEPENLVNSIMFLSEIEEDWKRPKGQLRGHPIFLPGADIIMGSVEPKSLTLWAGYDFSGKSKGVCQIVKNLAKNGKPVFFAPLEIGAKKALRWMARQELGREPIDYNDELTSIRKFGRCVFMYRPTTGTAKPTDIAEAACYAVKRWDCESVWIDNLSCVGISHTDYDAQTNFVRMLKFDIASKLNVAVHLVVHLRKPNMEHRGFPTRHDIRNVGSIHDLSDNILIFYRNEDSDEKKEKQRSEGVFNPPAWFIMDKLREEGVQANLKLNFDTMAGEFCEWDERRPRAEYEKEHEGQEFGVAKKSRFGRSRH